MTELYWNQHAAWPLLATLQLLPLAGAALLLKLGERPLSIALGRGLALAQLLLAVVLYRLFDSHLAGYQFAERLDWLGPLTYHAGADGVTVLFVLLSALIVFLITLYGLVRGLAEPARLLAVVLATQGVMMSMLTTLNLLWFALAAGAELLLLGNLVGYWSTSPDKERATARFYQFQSTGLLMLLAGVLILGWSHHDITGGAWTFDLPDLAGQPVPRNLGAVVFFLLFYGLGVRTPIFPLHGWLPTVAQHGSVAIAPALLLGVKVGIYGLVRFVMPLLPDVVAAWYPYVTGFAAAGVFYAALLAFQQTNLRRLMAFAVVSHTSLVVIGLFSLDHVALQGSLLLAANFGLAATAMMLMTGFVYRRTHTTRMDKLGGLFDRLPLIGLTYLVAGLAIIGMPGTPGFHAAHLVLESAIHRFGALPTVAAALGNVAAAGFLLWAFQRAFLAPAPAGRGTAIERAGSVETLIASILVLVLLWSGFHMTPWLDLVDAPMKALAGRFGHV
ncbi:MAG TPA: NADH-quinone oxidoreductase subunit M [Thiobacillaceae bacterium]|nr:NADH-quinone oxidoreductase subunit M [Thiobacillaceae bacterium]HNA82073.1 NADH-quinone oxidoreductase subunit M [Thiobacillaceae bacterium]HNF88311.1 NADH-quinone oxidoreductase subunit M [Thiobacillaceae bacterium]HNH90364.1 NADH-quinone oxidoreductase subunit M [Thiobacillaceae bacterium]